MRIRAPSWWVGPHGPPPATPSILSPPTVWSRAIGTAAGLVAVAVLILVNAFFVAGEFALVAVDRNRVERLANEGNRTAGRVLVAIRNLSFHLSGAQLGITVGSLLLGFIAEPAIASVLEPTVSRLPFMSSRTVEATSVGVALAISTAALMVLGELIPKNLAISYPLSAAQFFGVQMARVNGLVRPVIIALNRAANATVRLFGIEPREELSGVRSLEDLELVIRSSRQEGELDDYEMALLTRSIAFSEKSAADVMVPRVDVTGLSRSESLDDLRQASLQTGHSRFPIYGEDLDEIVGVVHIKDTFRVPHDRRASTSVESIATPPLVVPESRPLDSVLIDLQTQGRALAIVVDEYGGTAGIISLEDLLEEIVGDIADEHDTVEIEETRVGEGTILSGSARRYDVEETIGWAWPEGRYETLSGFIVATLGHFPRPGETVAAGGYLFEVAAMDGYRIATVLARRLA